MKIKLWHFALLAAILTAVLVAWGKPASPPKLDYTVRLIALENSQGNNFT